MDLNAIKENIKKVIIGNESTIDLILTALAAGGHVLLEDVPGTGKTVMAKSLAKSLELTFGRIQFTPDLLPTDITGLNYYNQKAGEFVFREGPIFKNLVLADEINRATPRTQSSLLECMEERQITADGETRLLERPFFVIATQNPIETAGTYPLPEAQLDRFLMKLSMELPDKEKEVSLMERFLQNNPLQELKSVYTKEQLLEVQKAYPLIKLHPDLLGYIADLVKATREHELVRTGVSPRGTLALMRSAQAYAMLHGREYVLPEDIKQLCIPVCSHRLVLRTMAASWKEQKEIMEEILEKAPVPTEDWEQ